MWRKRRKAFLTHEEGLVLKYLIGTSLQDKQIAYKLGVSTPTVRTHAGKVYRKYRVGGRLELIMRLLGRE
jgi:DNA-binding CsgD family transcriptional regulator